MLKNHSYFSKAKGGTSMFIDLYFMNISITFWSKNITKMKWSASWCFKNTVYYLSRMRTGKLKYNKS